MKRGNGDVGFYYFMMVPLYESLVLPLSIIMIVPMALLSALTGVWLTNGDNNISPGSPRNVQLSLRASF